MTPQRWPNIGDTRTDTALMMLRARADSILHPDRAHDLTEAECRAVIEAHEKRQREEERAFAQSIRQRGV